MNVMVSIVFVLFVSGASNSEIEMAYSKFEMDFRKQISLILVSKEDVQLLDDFFIFLESRLHGKMYDLKNFFIEHYIDENAQSIEITENISFQKIDPYENYKNERFYIFYLLFLEKKIEEANLIHNESNISLKNYYNLLKEKTQIFQHKNIEKFYFYSQNLKKDDLKSFYKDLKMVSLYEFRHEMLSFFF
ncbi:hypothetical protein GVAV_001879 [Gurleya vavrai]